MANRLIDYPNQTYTKTPEPPITTVGEAFSAQYGKVLAPIIEDNSMLPQSMTRVHQKKLRRQLRFALGLLKMKKHA
jgi:hypothetical protein